MVYYCENKEIKTKALTYHETFLQAKIPSNIGSVVKVHQQVRKTHTLNTIASAFTSSQDNLPTSSYSERHG